MQEHTRERAGPTSTTPGRRTAVLLRDTTSHRARLRAFSARVEQRHDTEPYEIDHQQPEPVTLGELEDDAAHGRRQIALGGAGGEREHEIDVRHVEEEGHPSEGDEDAPHRTRRPTEESEGSERRPQRHQQEEQRRGVLRQVEERHAEERRVSVVEPGAGVAVAAERPQRHESDHQDRTHPGEPARRAGVL